METIAAEWCCANNQERSSVKRAAFYELGRYILNFNIDSVGSELPKDKPRISETGTELVPEHEKEKLIESIREFAKREYDEDLDDSALW